MATGSGPPQTYEERRPVAGLAPVVSAAWVQTVASDAGAYLHRNAPHGGFELRFSTAAGLRVVGPQTAPTVTAAAPGTTEVGLRFKPGTAARVLGVSGAELIDTDIPADDVLGSAAARLAERLSAAPDPAQRARRLQQQVLGRLADTKDSDPVVDRVVAQLLLNASVPIDHLAGGVGLSPRQLRRRCHQAVGISSKALQRLTRFQRFQALSQRNLAKHGQPADAGLATLAVISGYADQAHLTRECVRLTGLSPRARLHELSHKCANHDHSVVFESFVR